jgi:hypothetical protein
MRGLEEEEGFPFCSGARALAMGERKKQREEDDEREEEEIGPAVPLL